MMNKLFKIIFIFSFFCSCSLSAKDREINDKLIKVNETNSQNIEKHFSLLRKAAKELEKNWDEKLASHFVKLYSQVSRHDQNSYVLQTFGELLKDKEERIKQLFKKNLSKEEYELFESNLLMHKREISEGNG